jgi:hypothetical protein
MDDRLAPAGFARPATDRYVPSADPALYGVAVSLHRLGLGRQALNPIVKLPHVVKVIPALAVRFFVRHCIVPLRAFGGATIWHSYFTDVSTAMSIRPFVTDKEEALTERLATL